MRQVANKELTHGSLFSGIGGFDLAAEWMGWENIFHCEWNPFGKRVLNYYWPNAKSYNDITKTDFTIHRGTIDVLSGGFPCQPYSMAGKRKGKEDERHLWPEMLRAIREIQPRYVVGENVLGLVNWNGGLVFEEVQVDLEAQGYDVQPYILPACGIDAPHRRERVWFVAYRNSCSAGTPRQDCKAKGDWCENYDEQKSRRVAGKQHTGRCEFLWVNSNANRNGFNIGNSKHEVHSGKGRKHALCDPCQGFANGFIIHSGSTGVLEHQATVIHNRKRNCKVEIQRKSNKPSRFRATNEIPDWKRFPTQSPVCDGDDGLSDQLDGITFPKWRSESIKAGGNAIVPQVAHQIFKAIEQFNEEL